MITDKKFTENSRSFSDVPTLDEDRKLRELIIINAIDELAEATAVHAVEAESEARK